MKSKTIALAAMSLFICGLFALNLFEGSIHIPAADVLDILLGRGEGLKPTWEYIVV